jgi:hypothetical protein
MRNTSKRCLRGVFCDVFGEALFVIQGLKHILNDIVILSGGGSDAVKLCSGLYSAIKGIYGVSAAIWEILGNGDERI